VNIEITQPNIDAACFQHPVVPPGTPAESGPPADCVVDKINQFEEKLSAPATSTPDKLIALKFLLHFVGDLHQPLHASDDNDSGGNAKLVKAKGLGSGKLHGFWDMQFVNRLGMDAATVAQGLVAKITSTQSAQWAQGTPTDWALESFQISKAQVYGKLPKPSSTGTYSLPASYVTASGPIVSAQLSKAGVRLATVLNRALGTP
jgi:hypothetical protein